MDGYSEIKILLQNLYVIVTIKKIIWLAVFTCEIEVIAMLE